MAETRDSQARTMDLRGATTVGVGAIVGGGIFVLAGVAFEATGPAAILAFLFNGLIALLTALSFAEISTSFPKSGGAYTFAKKVLSIRAAFGVGWFMWFAYIVAGVLYALGFAAYGGLFVESILEVCGIAVPSWLASRSTALLMAVGAIGLYSLSLLRTNSGGGVWATKGKVIVFVVLILAGFLGLFRQPIEQTTQNMSPFFSDGSLGLLSAMGFTFIALQGFDLIATIAGEIKEPAKVIPKAMMISLAMALVIYIPLLFLVSAVGVPQGATLQELATQHPETMVALAARNYMGPVGYWLVMVAAVMATLSALHANLLAASRVALAMARDHTLPRVFSTLHPTLQTPVMAIYATSLTLVGITLMVPNLAGAGAAASLIFLLSFALTHATTYLARKRMGSFEGAYQTPLFPLVPIVGGLCCGGLAIFQAVNVPGAGLIALFWLGLGSLLYVSLFSKGAKLADASAEGLDPTLVKLRGRSPFVLLPVANPAHAQAMVDIANSMAPSSVGRVLLLSIVTDEIHEDVEKGISEAQNALRKALSVSYSQGSRPEGLITRAPSAWDEIKRVATQHRCHSILLGLGQVSQGTYHRELKDLIEKVGCDVALMKSPPQWQLDNVRRVLVPVGGRGAEHELRARFLGSLTRNGNLEVTFISVVPTSTSESSVKTTMQRIERLAEVKSRGVVEVEVMKSDSPVEAILQLSATYDLIVLGLGQMPNSNLLENPAIRVAHECKCAAVLLSRHHTRRPLLEWPPLQPKSSPGK